MDRDCKRVILHYLGKRNRLDLYKQDLTLEEFLQYNQNKNTAYLSYTYDDLSGVVDAYKKNLVLVSKNHRECFISSYK